MFNSTVGRLRWKLLSRNVLIINRAFSTEKLFDKILIANRGEIACRVINTARKLNIKTVAVFSEPDRYSKHVHMADEAYCIGPAASAESYLSIPKILDVIKQTGAQAVHPGYGFLSENAHFCDELEKHGVVFIGPGKHAIEAMGDKIESKELAAKAGVNVIPGNLSVIRDKNHAIQIANEIGYPVMIKASAGGGGKGMRIAYNDKEAASGFRLSKDEAKKSFGDDRIFIEKYVEEPRHIEIQLIGDSHGNVCALPERECSIQRRNQKVLEEAPSVLLDAKTRREMQQQAIDLAKAVQYKSAGTVEFLCDKNKNFYFLEMNTRLQVEHPVTELVSGEDLVEQMIRVAAGHKLPERYMSGFLPFKGHALEARVYAEDPLKGFLPSTGRLLRYQEPSWMEGVRVDSGITQGSEISMFYDPMISKLCTYDETREGALVKLEEALDAYIIEGVGNNVGFLRDVCRAPRFKEGRLTTKYIQEEYPDGFQGVTLTNNEKMSAALIVDKIYRQHERSKEFSGQLYVAEIHQDSYIEINKVVYKVSSTPEGRHVVELGENDMETASLKNRIVETNWEYGAPIAEMKISEEEDDQTVQEQSTVQIFEIGSCSAKIQYCGAVIEANIYSPTEYKYKKYMHEKIEPDYSKFLMSPMPGQVISVAVKEGEEVFVGQELCVVEAMKMQNVLAAEKNGKVKKILRQGGENVAVDEIIIEFE